MNRDKLRPYRMADGTIDVDAMELGRPTPTPRPANVIDLPTSLTGIEGRFQESLRAAHERRAGEGVDRDERRRRRLELVASVCWAIVLGAVLALAIIVGYAYA